MKGGFGGWRSLLLPTTSLIHRLLMMPLIPFGITDNPLTITVSKFGLYYI